jgi:DNA-binding NarL/FixJ family response regulator
VLERVGRGLPDKVIAYELGLGVSTVSTMLWRLRRRFGLGGRTSMALARITEGTPLSAEAA